MLKDVAMLRGAVAYSGAIVLAYPVSEANREDLSTGLQSAVFSLFQVRTYLRIFAEQKGFPCYLFCTDCGGKSCRMRDLGCKPGTPIAIIARGATAGDQPQLAEK